MLQDLKNMIGNNGKVEDVYGGYEIMVNNIDQFPWYKIFMFLLESSFEVWMVKSNSKLIIMSKPAVD